MAYREAMGGCLETCARNWPSLPLRPGTPKTADTSSPLLI